MRDFNLNALIDVVNQPGTGVAAPVAYSDDGKLQDSARKFPTMLELMRRKLGRCQSPDYIFASEPISVDWVSGMFMVFRRDVYASVGGFDERYFMYFEDVDLCYRLQLGGFRVVLVPQVFVIHNAQRASSLKLKYFKWHLASAFRFLFTN